MSAANPLAKLARIDADIASLRDRLNARIDERQALLANLVAEGQNLKANVAAQVQAATRASVLASTGRLLTDEQVREIRRLHAAGMSQAAIGRKVGLSQPSIYKIVRHQSYQDVR